MDRRMERALVAVFAATALLIPAFALADGAVTVALTAQRLVAKSGGRETMESAEHAKPGDVIEYRATYRNTSDTGVKKLDATLPIPPGTEYLAKSADPAPALASLDGHTFAPLPLTRRVRLEDGREVVREVPASEYRSLRWSFDTLAAHGQKSVRARVKVTTGPVALAQH